MQHTSERPTVQRRAITVHGIVQGVGFRPFVYELARRCELSGFVLNRSGVVSIEIEGPEHNLDAFLSALRNEAPPLARIERVVCENLPPQNSAAFEILGSDWAPFESIFVSPDAATCAACLAELFDPADRRYRYPFINCTHCGPRLTIIESAPYDRERTTMQTFAMCPACAEEFHNPADRRFHAQPIACPDCGPRCELRAADGSLVPAADPTADPITTLAATISKGGIAAVKGLGGFHLACDATNPVAVQRLRQRKHRDEKPLAVMVADLATVRDFCEIDEAEEFLLLSPAAPIVLLRKRGNGKPIAEAVAPGNPHLGVMLPYTPLHHLLLHACGHPLVLTSGNQADEPIAQDNQDALTRLAGIADQFLLHDRAIHVRCDDSVTRVADGVELPVRRSRGYAPQPVPLPLPCRVPTLAVGGQMKGTFALAQADQAIVSHHLGDLDHLAAYQAFERDVKLYEQLFEITPELIVHDLHPEYAATQYARRLAEQTGIATLAVQHHHAHLASCLAENGLDEPVIGVTFDGTGYGTDGAVWGGEFLIGGLAQFERAAHLRYVGMSGGAQAIRQPWRMAVAHLLDAGIPPAFPRELAVTPNEIETIERMLACGFNSPQTSSMGRLFDTVAALIGLKSEVSFEGQAAMQLEALATATLASCTSAETDKLRAQQYPVEIACSSAETAWQIDTRSLIRAIASDMHHGREPGQVAVQFHHWVVEMVATMCERLRRQTQLAAVVLSGGVFLNALLTTALMKRLEELGFRVYRHRVVPPGDGGLCLGQLAIAAAIQETNHATQVAGN